MTVKSADNVFTAWCKGCSIYLR